MNTSPELPAGLSNLRVLRGVGEKRRGGGERPGQGLWPGRRLRIEGAGQKHSTTRYTRGQPTSSLEPDGAGEFSTLAKYPSWALTPHRRNLRAPMASETNKTDLLPRNRSRLFSLGDHETTVHATSTEDFLVYISARNVETFRGGVAVSTPPSQFRTSGATGPRDGLVLDVPAQESRNLGCIGGKRTEKIDFSNAFGARVTLFLTVVTCQGATVTMSGEK
jgi:hypothetical protein